MSQSIYVHLPLPDPLYFIINGKKYQLKNLPVNPTIEQQWAIAKTSKSSMSFNSISSLLHLVKLGQLHKSSKSSIGGDFPTIIESNIENLSLDNAKKLGMFMNTNIFFFFICIFIVNFLYM